MLTRLSAQTSPSLAPAAGMSFALSCGVSRSDAFPTPHLTVLVLLLSGTPAAGSPPPGAVQALGAIARRAEAAVQAVIPLPPGDQEPAALHRVAAREPDARLRLPACGAALEAAIPLAAGGLRPRTLVQVRCTAATGHWAVLVPVTIETETLVLEATRNIRRGQRPGSGDVRSVMRVIPGISNTYVTNLAQIADQHVIRPVAAGQPLTRDALRADPVVRRGESVTLVADIDGVEVRVPGRALADAQPGETVRAQNASSLKIIEGRADDRGRVRVRR